MTKRVLMIAYHFPPSKGSSGLQRTLKFSQYLPQFGWQPLILSASKRAYATTSREQLNNISAEVKITRAFALDTARHFSINGAYSKLLAIPDRWVSWLLGGIVSGLQLIYKMKPQIIWSTYPIATAHLIGYGLHRLTGLPWIADLRDPMAQEGYPEDPLRWKSFKWIEDKIARHAAAICFTSPSAIDEFMNKHRGTVSSETLHLIENGYDEECFTEAEAIAKANTAGGNRPLTLLHSGIIYPSERDPRPFFQALANLKKIGAITATSFRVVFRAAGHDDYLAEHIRSAELEDIIQLAPPIPYIDALVEMLAADGLILFQASNCNYQIPAKLYEYIRAGRPIFAMTDTHGDTAKILPKTARNSIANIASSDDIENKIVRFISLLGSVAESPESIEHFSRREKTRELANLLDSIAYRVAAASPPG